MKFRLTLLILILFWESPLFSQMSSSTNSTDLSTEAILLKQATNKQTQPSPSQSLNERIRTLPRLPKSAQEYLLGPGDSIELTVVGIPGLEKKEFLLDGQGQVNVPYLGQVDILGLSAHGVESKLIRMFAVSLLEDPQVTVGIKEYRSQYYYVWGSVLKPGKYTLTQSADLLDAISLAGGLTDKADSKLKLYRCPQLSESKSPTVDAAVQADNAEAANEPEPCSPLEISLPELLEGKQNINRLAIISGDVIAVGERKEQTCYVLGDILKPGAYPIRPNEQMALSQALANAGGLLRTASGKKMLIIRRKAGQALPEQIRINAYALLKGEIPDLELLDDDIVLVPGSASKTLGKSFLSGVGGALTALLYIGTR